MCSVWRVETPRSFCGRHGGWPLHKKRLCPNATSSPATAHVNWESIHGNSGWQSAGITQGSRWYTSTQMPPGTGSPDRQQTTQQLDSRRSCRRGRSTRFCDEVVAGWIGAPDERARHRWVICGLTPLGTGGLLCLRAFRCDRSRHLQMSGEDRLPDLRDHLNNAAFRVCCPGGAFAAGRRPKWPKPSAAQPSSTC